MKNKSRTKTRICAMEVVYQWLYTQPDIQTCLDRYKKRQHIDYGYLEDIVLGAFGKKSEINDKISQYLEDRELSEVSKIEYSILLISCYELMFLYDVPYKVVINEAVNMVKSYGAQDAHKFINSILDRIAKDVRGMECQ